MKIDLCFIKIFVFCYTVGHICGLASNTVNHISNLWPFAPQITAIFEPMQQQASVTISTQDFCHDLPKLNRWCDRLSKGNILLFTLNKTD